MSEAEAVGGWLPAFAMRFFFIDPPKPADPAQWFPASEGGCATCPSNPLTPFRVELDASLGERVVFDLGRVPPREVPAIEGRD